MYAYMHTYYIIHNSYTLAWVYVGIDSYIEMYRYIYLIFEFTHFLHTIFLEHPVLLIIA